MQPRTDRLLVQAQVIVAAAMTGIIWMVQCVTYPQFLDVPATAFPEFHARYTAVITPIVAPPMILELGLALGSAWHFRRSPVCRPMLVCALLSVVLWLTTFFVQVPLHGSLAGGWSEAVIRELVATNWIRTILWSLRLGLLSWIGLCLMKS